MGVEFSCCTGEDSENRPSPLPPVCVSKYIGSPARSESRDCSQAEEWNLGIPRISMRKDTDTVSAPEEVRGISRMSASLKRRPQGDRSACSLFPENPFDLAQAITERLNESAVDAMERRTDGSLRAPSRGELHVRLGLGVRPDYDYHSPPRWFWQQHEYVSLVRLGMTSERFLSIVERVNKTLHVTVTKIEKVCNVPLYRSFADTHEDISRQDGCTQAIMELFYGTGKIDPYVICTSLYGLDSSSIQAFDTTLVCFTDSAKESAKFAFRKVEGFKQLLLCLVTVGEPVELLPEDDVTEQPLRMSGMKPALAAVMKKRSSNVYIVYEKKMSYPAYVITYKDDASTKAQSIS